MTPEFFRRLAQQCRDLTRRARAEATKRQLAMWIDEFEARAEAAEHTAERNKHGNC
jgi:transcription elongation GreA/GreB family factor